MLATLVTEMAASIRERLTSLLNQFQSLPSSSIATMKEISVLISSATPSVISEALKDIQLSPLFGYVSDIALHQKENKEEAVEFLNKILSTISPEVLVNRFSSELVLALQHQSPDIREIGLKQVKRCAADNIAVSIMLKDIDMISSTVELISDDMALAKYSISILAAMGKDVDAVQVIFSPSINKVFEKLLSQKDVIRFRAFEVIVKIACSSSEALHEASRSGYLQLLVAELKTDDILLLLNCVELLTHLALVSHGLEWLEQKGIIKTLKDVLTHSLDSTTGVFILPGLMKFFGTLGHSNPSKLFMELPDVVQLIFSLTENSDSVLKYHAIRAIGYIGVFGEGKMLLSLQGDKMVKYLLVIGSMIQTGTTEAKLEGLATMFDLLNIVNGDSTTDAETVTESWYRSIMSDALAKLMSYCKCPFLDLRCSALHILKAIAPQQWGLKELASYPGFLEYLLDRSTETDKEGMEAKYNIVEVLVNSPNTSTVFDHEAIRQLNHFYSLGPFYVEAESTVAYEGAT